MDIHLLILWDKVYFHGKAATYVYKYQYIAIGKNEVCSWRGFAEINWTSSRLGILVMRAS